MKQLVKQLLDSAEYQDGNATVPAYLLELLADAAGVKLLDRHYTEVIKG